MFIKQQIERINRNQLVTGLILAGISGVLILFNVLPSPFSLLFWVLHAWADWQIIQVVRVRLNPESHPIMKRLVQFGDLNTVIQNIESEVSGGLKKIGDGLVTAHWWFDAKMKSLEMIHLPDVVWAYEKVRKNFQNGLQKQSDLYVMVKTSDGSEHAIELLHEDKIKELLAHISAAAPHALIGYSEELNSLWNENRVLFVSKILAKSGR